MIIDTIQDAEYLIMASVLTGLVGYLFFAGFYILFKLGIRWIRKI